MRTRPVKDPNTQPLGDGVPFESSVEPTEARKEGIQAEEAYAILIDMQRQEELAGTIPRPPWLFLDRGRVVCECLGGILLGILTATTALVTVFVIANWFLHLQF
jgi:hypothetical protein